MLTATFTPRTAGAPCFQRYVISTPAGTCRQPLSLRGAGGGPSLALSARCLDFGDARVGARVAKVIYLENRSEVAAAYEFRDDGGGVFTLSAPWGVVGPKSVGHTRVAFEAGAPANYWRRLICIVKVRVAVACVCARVCVHAV